MDKIRYQFTCLPFGLSCAPWAFTMQGLKTSGHFPKKLRNSPYRLYRRYTGSVLQLETGSSSRSSRCFSAGLGASEGIRQPSVVLNGESSETGESSSSSSDPGGPSLEGSTVVSSSSGDAVGFSSVDSLV